MRRAIDRPSPITGDRYTHAEYGVGPATDYAGPNGARVKAPFPGTCTPYLTLTGGPGVIVTLGDWMFFCQHMGADRPSGSVSEGQDLGYITKAGSMWDGYHWHQYIIAGGTRLSMEEFFSASGFVGGSRGDVVQPTLTSLSGGGTTPFPPEDELSQAQVDTIMNAIRRGTAGRLFYDGGPNGDLPFDDPRVTRAVIGRGGSVFVLPSNATDRKTMIELERGAGDGIFLPAAELPDVMTSAAFMRTVDFLNDEADAPFGRFEENLIALEGGSTRQVRTDGHTVEYENRQQVWRDGRPVRITKDGVTTARFVRSGSKSYAEDALGVRRELTTAEVDRANAQRPSGQTWHTV